MNFYKLDFLHSIHGTVHDAFFVHDTDALWESIRETRYTVFSTHTSQFTDTLDIGECEVLTKIYSSSNIVFVLGTHNIVFLRSLFNENFCVNSLEYEQSKILSCLLRKLF